MSYEDKIGKKVRISYGETSIVGVVTFASDEHLELELDTQGGSHVVFSLGTAESGKIEVIEPTFQERLDSLPDFVLLSYQDGTEFIKIKNQYYKLPQYGAVVLREDKLTADSLALVPTN